MIRQPSQRARINPTGRIGRSTPIRRRGNALVMAIALVSILAIMGSTFVIVTSLDREAVRAAAEQAGIDSMEDVILTGIGNILTIDVAGKREPSTGNRININPDGDTESSEQQTNFLAETTATFDPNQDQPGTRERPRRFLTEYAHPVLGMSGIFHENEPFDFPSHMIFGVPYDETFFSKLAGQDRLIGTKDDNWLAGDDWLADLEPDVTAPSQPVWRHISDVQGRLAELTLDPNLSGDDGIGDPTQGRGTLAPNRQIDFTAVLPYFVDPALDSQNGRQGERIPDKILAEGYPADADGDGVTDSRWVRWRVGQDLGGNPTYLKTSEGHDVYVAVRIVDNAAMLNLNTVGDGTNSNNGENLTDTDPTNFARRNETPDLLLAARGVQSGQLASFNDYLLDLVDVPGRAKRSDPPQFKDIRLFDLADEIEIHGRNVIDSPTVARFESAWPTTFDSPLITSKREPFGLSRSDRIQDWAAFMTEIGLTGIDRYDRRHLATFHSWDRTVRIGGYPAQRMVTGQGQQITALVKGLDDPKAAVTATRRKLFPDAPNLPDLSNIDLNYIRDNFGPLIYGFRAYFLDQIDTNGNPINNVQQAAKKAAQVMANLIDYVDASDPNDFEIIGRGDGGGQNADVSPLFADMTSSTPVPLTDPFPGGTQTRTFTDVAMQRKSQVTYLNMNVIESLLKLHPQQGGGVDVDHPDNTASDETTLDAAPYPNSNPNYVGVDFGLPQGVMVYGYEPQPFITQIVAYWKYKEAIDPNTGKPYLPPRLLPDKVIAYAVELYNPYKESINLDGWRIRAGLSGYEFPDNISTQAETVIEAGRSLIVVTTPLLDVSQPPNTGQPGDPGLWISDNDQGPVGTGAVSHARNLTVLPNRVEAPNFIISRGATVYLDRPMLRPAPPTLRYLTVDSVDPDETKYINPDKNNTSNMVAGSEPYHKIFSSRRGGSNDEGMRDWRFVNNEKNRNYDRQSGVVWQTAGYRPLTPAGTAAPHLHPFGLGVGLTNNNPGWTPNKNGRILSLNTKIIANAAGGSNRVDYINDWDDVVALIGHKATGPVTNKPITEVIADGKNSKRDIFLDFEPRIGTVYAADGVSLLDYFTFIRKKKSLANKRELRMHGRVNLNTAPAMVLEAVLDGAGITNPGQKALDILDYRDGVIDPLPGRATGHLGFHRVAELYNSQLFTQDEADRLVNLFTVRTDVVTAYVDIRVQAPGDLPDNPSDDVLVAEKRLMVLYDRSNVYEAGQQPRILTRYEVPGTR